MVEKDISNFNWKYALIILVIILLGVVFFLTYKNWELSEKIQGLSEKVRTYEELTQEIKRCDAIPISEETIERRNHSFLSLAIVRRNPELCWNLIDTYSAVDCLIKLAIIMKDFSICEEIFDRYDRESCYYEFAFQTDNPEVCFKIKDDSYRDSCFYDVAQQRRDVTICNQIQDKEYQEECRKGIEGEKK